MCNLYVYREAHNDNQKLQHELATNNNLEIPCDIELHTAFTNRKILEI